jgi:hypothetical protein
VEYFTK